MEVFYMNDITIRDLSYKYPTAKEGVLFDINLEINKGKFYAVIGSNGSGKTTLCNILRGFIPHFYKGDLTGEVLIDGKDIRNYELGELSKKIGFAFQNPFTQISGIKETVFEEIAFGLENLGIVRETIKEKVEAALTLFNLENLRNNNPNELSGGQKQRVALASIVVMEPDILVIDEPTSQLDPQSTESIFRIIEMMKKKGKTIILVEHKIELIAEYADYVIVMQDGRIAKQGETAEVLKDEKLLIYDAPLPQYALLGFEMRKRNLELENIPITESEALSALKNWLD